MLTLCQCVQSVFRFRLCRLTRNHALQPAAVRVCMTRGRAMETHVAVQVWLQFLLMSSPDVDRDQPQALAALSPLSRGKAPPAPTRWWTPVSVWVFRRREGLLISRGIELKLLLIVVH